MTVVRASRRGPDQKLDVSDGVRLAEACQDHDLVIDCLSPSTTLSPPVSRACAEAGTSLLSAGHRRPESAGAPGEDGDARSVYRCGAVPGLLTAAPLATPELAGVDVDVTFRFCEVLGTNTVIDLVDAAGAYRQRSERDDATDHAAVSALHGAEVSTRVEAQPLGGGEPAGSARGFTATLTPRSRELDAVELRGPSVFDLNAAALVVAAERVLAGAAPTGVLTGIELFGPDLAATVTRTIALAGLSTHRLTDAPATVEAAAGEEGWL